MKNKTLNSLRIETELFNKIQSAIRKLNKQSLAELSLAEFRRLSYYYFSNLILSEDDIKKILQLTK